MRHLIWCILAAAIATLVFAPTATGQATTRPASGSGKPALLKRAAPAAAPVPAAAPAADGDDWPGVVARFGRALAEGNVARVRALMADTPSFKSIDAADEAAGPDALAARTAGAQVLGAHPYSFPPMVMAADVAADLKLATAVPDAARKPFIPGDDEEMKRANATAVQWVAQVLAPGKGTPVALILMWDDAARDAATTPTPLFVLLKGAEQADGSYKVTRVVYGHPDQAAQ